MARYVIALLVLINAYNSLGKMYHIRCIINIKRGQTVLFSK